jgi:hypothetical protein
MTDLSLLSQAQMRRIVRYFPLSHGVARVDDRRIVSAIVFVIKNGLRWRDARSMVRRALKSAPLRAVTPSDKKVPQSILRLFLQTTATYPHPLILDPLGSGTALEFLPRYILKKDNILKKTRSEKTIP